jgi:hypothetical protein
MLRIVATAMWPSLAPEPLVIGTMMVLRATAARLTAWRVVVETLFPGATPVVRMALCGIRPVPVILFELPRWSDGSIAPGRGQQKHLPQGSRDRHLTAVFSPLITAGLGPDIRR